MRKKEDVVIHLKKHNDIKYLIGKEISGIKPFVPFHDLCCDFLNDLSKDLHLNKEASKYSDIMTFAFWCRKANISKLKKDFNNKYYRLGLGLVFHIAPSNVPINFAFSFVFGLLSGNANIVRVPSKNFNQISIICDSINRIINKDKYRRILEMNCFIQYVKNDAITAAYSLCSNARLIWGGDNTIKNIRKFDTIERCVDIAFSDRYSFCIIDAPSVLQLNDKELTKLSESFYNDTYLVDQNACSSPHMIVWQGENKESAKEKFWTSLSNIVAKKYFISEIQVVDKYTLICHDSIRIDHLKYVVKHGNDIYRIGLGKIDENIYQYRGESGYFYEYDNDEINNIKNIINNKFQTLTYFGLNKNKLRDFAINNRLLGIDRIVPIGQALDIGVIWDGYDILNMLTRIIDIK